MDTSRAAPGTVRDPDVGRAQRRLELLTQANRAILGERSLTTVLHQIASSACELVGARYAALAVVGPDGELAELIHVGMDEALVREIEGRPQGLGLLRVLIDDPRSSGVPLHQRTTETFLEVPIKVRDVLYGNLYLAQRADGGAFSVEDQETIAALGVTAGIAIENARLLEESRRRQHWAEAAAAVSSALLDPAGETDPVGLIADTVLRLTGADVVSVVVPVEVPSGEPAMFRVRLARGVGAENIVGLRYPASQSVAALALTTGRGVRVASLADEPRFFMHLRQALDVDAVLGLPLHGSVGSHGALVVARGQGREPFDLSDLELGESFAAQAAIAMELAQARVDQQRLVVLQDRERIARDLHDHVIQRLFASGLSLEGLAGSLDPAVASRLVSVVEDLDVTIRQIRNLIFRLQPPSGTRTLRSAVLGVVEEVTPVLGFAPDVSFLGPVDTVADDALVDDVAAVAREAVSNVVRHAGADRLAVTVAATATRLTVVVVDDGVGLSDVPRRSGLENLARRALRHGGGFELVDVPTGGTELRWSVPLA